MAVEKASILNSMKTLLVNDSDLSKYELFLTGGKSGVLFSDPDTKTEFGLTGTTTPSISSGSAVIVCTRATSTPIPNQKIAVKFDLQGPKAFTNAVNGSKIYIEINQTLIDDPTLIEDNYPSTDYALGLNIGTINMSTTYPTINSYTALYEYNGTVWTDVRTSPTVNGKNVDLTNLVTNIITTGNITANNITATGNVTTGVPTSGSHATTKTYVDASILSASSVEALVENGDLTAGESITKNDVLFTETAPTFAEATSIDNIGDTTSNKRKAIIQVSNGTPITSFKLGLKKFVAPSDNLNFRIESVTQTTYTAVTSITGTYIASASSQYNASYAARKAFDGTLNIGAGNEWAAIGVTGWLKIQLPSAVKIYKYVIYPTGTDNPTARTFEGSNDNTTRTTLNSQTGVSGWVAGTGKEYACTSTTAYLYYRVNITASNGGNTGFAELQLFRLTDTGVYCNNNMLGMMTANTTTGVSSQDAQAGYTVTGTTGTLINANGIATVTPASLTTSIVDTTVTLAGSVTIPEGTQYAIVPYVGTYGSETVNATNYYGISYAAKNTTTRGMSYYNGTARNTNLGIFPYITNTGAYTKLLSKADATYSYKLPTDYTRIANANYTVGQKPICTRLGLYDGFTGLTANTLYYLATNGAISTVAGTNSYAIGTTNNNGILDLSKANGPLVTIVSGTLNASFSLSSGAILAPYDGIINVFANATGSSSSASATLQIGVTNDPTTNIAQSVQGTLQHGHIKKGWYYRYIVSANANTTGGTYSISIMQQ